MGGKDNEKIYKLGIIAAKEMLPEIRSELKKRNILK
jgi:hypothetical protein